MVNKKVLIIGSGISGLTVAHELIVQGYSVSLVEQDDIIGGMAKTRRENNNIPSEHSWRGFGPHYKNLFNILNRIPISHSESVYHNLSLPINFNILYDNNPDSDFKNQDTNYPYLKLRDIILIIYLYSKYLVSNKRRSKYYQLKIKDYSKYLSQNMRKVVNNFLLGPAYGMELKDASVGHFCKFSSIYLLNQLDYNYYYFKNNQKYFSNSRGNWHVLNQPTNEAWFDPWIQFLKSKGLQLFLNTKLDKIDTYNNQVKNITVIQGNKYCNLKADYYVICIDPFSAEHVFKRSNMLSLYFQHKMVNDNTISNQISFRFGFYKKIIFDKRNHGYVLIDSEYNITFYPQDYNFDEQIELSKNKDIKSLWSGTILFTTFEPGKLYKTPAINLNKEQLKNEILYQFTKSNDLQTIIFRNNNFFFTPSLVDYFEIWYETGIIDTKSFAPKNKKWVNNIYNEQHRPVQKTEYNNLFLAGSHTKTTTEIWSMEGAAESGKIVAKLISDKYIYIYNHCDYKWLDKFKLLDDFLYQNNLPCLIDILLIIIILILFFYLKKINFKFISFI